MNAWNKGKTAYFQSVHIQHQRTHSSYLIDTRACTLSTFAAQIEIYRFLN